MTSNIFADPSMLMVDLTNTDRTEIANPESMCAMVDRCYLMIYGHPSIMGIRDMNSWESVHAGYYINILMVV